MSARRIGLAALALAPLACGGGQTHGSAFDPAWSNDGGAGIAAFQQRFASTPVPIGADVAVGVVEGALIGAPLDGGPTWTFTHALDARPAIAGDVVVGTGGGELFILDAKTGKPLSKRRASGRLRGAGDDGKTTVVSLVSATGKGTTVLAISHAGDVVRQIEDEAAIGVPAVVGSVVFLPWSGQYVTAYDLLDGEEKARALLRTATSRAFTRGGAVFFGESTATRFDEKIRQGATNQASTVSLPARELPGTPRWYDAGTEVETTASGAPDRIHLYARPNAKGSPGVDGGRFAATYYRIVVGFDAQSGALAWAHGHDAEIVGGDAYEGGFALCDDQGTVTFLDAKTGAVAGHVSLGKPVTACVVQTDGFKKEGGPAPEPLALGLAKVIEMPQAEHVMIQRFLLRELAALEDETVTKALIDLASSERTPPMLLEDARKALAARRNGVGFMLDALKRRYDFLADVLRPPPVGPLADALAAMKEKRAAPLLAAHLNDPADTLDDAQRAAAALVVLADKPEQPALATFFALYRGTADDEKLVAAVASAAEALARVGGSAQVAAAAKDPFTTEAVRAKLAALVKEEAKPADAKAPAAPTVPGKKK